ncbi:PREDICTED: gibberellin 20 oxidase 5-like [Tarenaya hassleriana]|uniref:gibberellin 20 oxidase 5-like n=1 Tax=Tarenaya hassleriana TaxID=28532 RepID=UPI00053C5B4F|nr:PREDICTED: gibberellin 20 oxidase 5-like [Tarenaya hassleriana]
MAPSFFNLSQLQTQQKIPAGFVWPDSDVIPSEDVLNLPVIDLAGFMAGDEAATKAAAAATRAACEEFGAFQVVNHGVDWGLAERVQNLADWFFGLPENVKLRAEKIPGTVPGYSGAHGERFSSTLSWKEMMTFVFSEGSTPVVEDFVRSTLGKEFEEMGKVYQKYCEAVNGLCLELMELLGISLGLEDRNYYRKFFEDGRSILRCNYYRPCNEPDRTLGTGPHCDPTSLTILLQDHVPGLDVFSKGKWWSVRPCPKAFVINIGDTFTALSNGKYKSCLHRAVVSKDEKRRSFAFFLCPRDDKLVMPPMELISGDSDEEAYRRYPDFTWSDLLRFTQSSYRVDESTLDNFISWFTTSSAKNPVYKDQK